MPSNKKNKSAQTAEETIPAISEEEFEAIEAEDAEALAEAEAEADSGDDSEAETEAESGDDSEERKGKDPSDFTPPKKAPLMRKVGEDDDGDPVMIAVETESIYRSHMSWYNSRLLPSKLENGKFRVAGILTTVHTRPTAFVTRPAFETVQEERLDMDAI